MAKRILIPLDRSMTAESIVSLVGDLARGSNASLRLLYVAPRPCNLVDRDGHVIAFADQEMSSLESEGLDYLHSIERMLGDLPVASIVRFGNPTEEILREADDSGADLIAVSTTGRNGFNHARQRGRGRLPARARASLAAWYGADGGVTMRRAGRMRDRAACRHELGHVDHRALVK